MKDINSTLKDNIGTLKDNTITLQDDIGTLKDTISTLNNALYKSSVTMHTEIEKLNTERFLLYDSKIALMEAHDKEKQKIQAEAHANLLKMQVQAKESAVPGTSLPQSSLHKS